MPPRLPGLFTGIGLESGVISYGGLYTLPVRLDFDVKGTAEHFTVTGADGHSYEFSYSFYMPFFEITGFRAPWDTDGYCLLFCVYLSADTP